jgi:transaldolase
MKIFIDTADINEIKEIASWGVLEGVTTNPTLIARTGLGFRETINEICKLVDGPISVEVTSTDAEEMIKEARQLAKIHPNIIIKIPITSEGLKATAKLSKEGITINTTLVFSANQAMLAAKAGAEYVSPFIGRLDDIGNEGMQVVRDIAQIFKQNGIKTKLLVASIRHPIHVIESAKAGADVVTIPPQVIRKMVMHPLTTIGIKKFLEDWKRVPKK